MGALKVDEAMQQLDPAVVIVWRLIGLAVVVPLVVLAAVVALVSGVGWLWPVASMLLLLGTAAVVWLPAAAYERFRWSAVDGVVRIQHGIVFRTQASVPVFRIQHIDLTQGPLDRWAGLQHLVIHTAAPGADLELPGIAVADAPRLRTELLTLARAATAAAGSDGTVDAV